MQLGLGLLVRGVRVRVRVRVGVRVRASGLLVRGVGRGGALLHVEGLVGRVDTCRENYSQ